MKEIVKYELAKLLKEKGFEGAKSPLWYYKDGTLHKTPTVGYKGFKCWNTWDATQGVRWDAPTIAEVVDWLYEKHDIWIYAKQGYKWEWYIESVGDKIEEIYNDGLENSPTAAYEEAIKFCLTTLI